MQVIRLYMHNALRNFNYLLYCQRVAPRHCHRPFRCRGALQKQANISSIFALLSIRTSTAITLKAIWLCSRRQVRQCWRIPMRSCLENRQFKSTRLCCAGRRSCAFCPRLGTQAHLCLLAKVMSRCCFRATLCFNASAGNCKTAAMSRIYSTPLCVKLRPCPIARCCTLGTIT